MKRKVLLPLLLTFLAGLGVGRLSFHDRVTVAQAHEERPVLYYHCPMHPSFHSDKAGISPCCHMKLEPVFADSAEHVPANPAPGAIHIDAGKQQLIGVRFGKAEYRTMTQSIRVPARVILNEEKVARVQTKLDGWIDQVSATQAGDEVRKGKQLLTIYNPKSLPAQQDFVRALEGLPMTEQGAPILPREPGSSGREGFIAAAKLRLELLGFTDAQIDTIAMTRQPMWKLSVNAPISGVVIERNVLPKQKVTPDTLYVIADLSSVWVVADVFDYASASPGQLATLTVPALPGMSFHGLVESVLPQLDPVTHTVKVRLRFDNPDRKLKPEMYGDLEIRSGVGRRALTVPREAILDNGLKQRVFVDLGNGYLEPKEVQVGQSIGDRCEIRKGLKAGQPIVVSGNFLLDSESRLNPLPSNTLDP